MGQRRREQQAKKTRENGRTGEGMPVNKLLTSSFHPQWTANSGIVTRTTFFDGLWFSVVTLDVPVFIKKSYISGSTQRIKMIKASKFVINVSMKRQVFFCT